MPKMEAVWNTSHTSHLKNEPSARVAALTKVPRLRFTTISTNVVAANSRCRQTWNKHCCQDGCRAARLAHKNFVIVTLRQLLFPRSNWQMYSLRSGDNYCKQAFKPVSNTKIYTAHSTHCWDCHKQPDYYWLCPWKTYTRVSHICSVST